LKKKIFVIISGFLSLIIACKDNGLAPYLVHYDIPAKNISYIRDLQPLFNGKCGFGSNCHAPENPENLLFFGSKDVFIQHVIPGLGRPLVDPDIDRFSPEQAPLYRIVTENLYSGFEIMPPFSYNRPQLTKAEVQGIRQWISEGAGD